MKKQNIIDIGLGLVLVWLIVGVVRINNSNNHQNTNLVKNTSVGQQEKNNQKNNVKVWLVPVDKELKADQNFDIEVLIDTGGKNLGAFNMYLDFDPTKITIDTTQGIDPSSDTGRGFDKGSDTTSYTIMSNSDDIANGHFRFAGITASGYANGNSEHLIIIHAKAIKTVNTKNLSLRVGKLSDELGHSIVNNTSSK